LDAVWYQMLTGASCEPLVLPKPKSLQQVYRDTASALTHRLDAGSIQKLSSPSGAAQIVRP